MSSRNVKKQEPEAPFAHLLARIAALESQVEKQEQEACRRKRYHQEELNSQKRIIEVKDGEIRSLQEEVRVLKNDIEMLKVMRTNNVPQRRTKLPDGPRRAYV
jgi:hypothetical protein